MAHVPGKRDNPAEPWINPYQLLQKMNNQNIEYGYYDFKNKARITYDNSLFNDKEYIYENCYVLHPREVWKYKIGICWDCAMMEWYWCKRIPNINPHVLYIEGLLNIDDIENSTHTALYYCDTKYNQWYIMEYSWALYKGFYGPFNNKKELFMNYLNNILYRNYSVIFKVNDDVNVNSIYNKVKITFKDFKEVCDSNAMEINGKFWNKFEE